MPREKHGHRGRNSPTYRSWCAMRKRCRNPADPDFHRYGGRGIRVCARWDDFECFLADMGVRPAKRTLERIDNSGHYEPGNCTWATAQQQARNRRPPSNAQRHAGKTVREWAAVWGVSLNTATSRLRRGTNPEHFFKFGPK